MTNTIMLLTVVLTNWTNIPGDWKRESGTNYVQQRFTVTTNIYVAEIHLCTNLTLFSTSQGTNGPTRWTPAQPPLPSLPGVMTKE